MTDSEPKTYAERMEKFRRETDEKLFVPQDPDAGKDTVSPEDTKKFWQRFGPFMQRQKGKSKSGHE